MEMTCPIWSYESKHKKGSEEGKLWVWAVKKVKVWCNTFRITQSDGRTKIRIFTAFCLDTATPAPYANQSRCYHDDDDDGNSFTTVEFSVLIGQMVSIISCTSSSDQMFQITRLYQCLPIHYGFYSNSVHMKKNLHLKR